MRDRSLRCTRWLFALVLSGLLAFASFRRASADTFPMVFQGVIAGPGPVRYNGTALATRDSGGSDTRWVKYAVNANNEVVMEPITPPHDFCEADCQVLSTREWRRQLEAIHDAAGAYCDAHRDAEVPEGPVSNTACQLVELIPMSAVAGRVCRDDQGAEKTAAELVNASLKSALVVRGTQVACSNLVLLGSPMPVSAFVQGEAAFAATSESLLVRKDTWQILDQTRGVIGKQLAYFDPSEATHEACKLPVDLANITGISQWAQSQGSLSIESAFAEHFRKCKSSFRMGPGLRYAPIPSAHIDIMNGFMFRDTLSASDGSYQSQGIAYPYDYYDVSARVPFRMFNPRVPSSAVFYLAGTRGQIPYPNIGINPIGLATTGLMGAMAAISIMSNLSLTAGVSDHSVVRTAFPLDARMLSTTFVITNRGPDGQPIGPEIRTVSGLPHFESRWPVGQTRYSIPPPIPGSAEPPFDGHKGLVQDISVIDLRDTSIYIFRQSDGRLIGHKWGLSDQEIACDPAVADPAAGGPADPCARTGWRVGAGNVSALVRAVQRRVITNNSSIGQPALGLEIDYANYNEEGPKVLANAISQPIRPQDPLKLVLINHATGYIGTTTVTDSRSPFVVSSDEIEMRPPNLCVWAERAYKVEHGATKGKEREYTIGSEGAAMTSDDKVIVYTEWLDADGTPLPAELPGFTGRFALALPDENVHQDGRSYGRLQARSETTDTRGSGYFTIRPGLHAQTLDLPAGSANGKKAHYYIHVDGTSPEADQRAQGQNALGPHIDFSVNKLCVWDRGGDPGAYTRPDIEQCDGRDNDLDSRIDEDHPAPGSGTYSCTASLSSTCYDTRSASDVPDASPDRPLYERPWTYVPVLVPKYDKKATDERREKFEEQGLPDPGPVYNWVYRPEFQFSMLELDQIKIERTDVDGNETVLLDTEPNPDVVGTPFIASSDRSLSLDALVSQDLVDELTRFDGTRTLIFSTGDDTPIVATLNEDRQWVFRGDITGAELAEITALQLLQNGDEGNVLYEYAFENLVVATAKLDDPRDQEDGSFIVTPEDNVVELHATLLGYASRDEDEKRDVLRFRWKIGSPTTAIGEICSPDTTACSQLRESNDPEDGVTSANIRVTDGRIGDVYTVEVAVVDEDDLKADFRVKVAPGKPASLAVAFVDNQEITAGEIGSREVDITVLDRWGNPVAEGTSVELRVDGPATIGRRSDSKNERDGEAEEAGAPVTFGTDADGKLKAKLVASSLSGEEWFSGEDSGQAKLYVKTGELVEQVHPFAVHPVNLTIEDWPETTTPIQLNAGAEQVVKAKVTDFGNEPIEGVEVQFFSTHAVFPTGVVKTNNEGIAEASFGTGWMPVDNAKVTAVVGLWTRESREYRVNPPVGQSVSGAAVLVGDVASPGTVRHVRADDSTVDIAFSTSTELRVQGDPGTTLELRLGDLSDPNIDPLVSLYMDEVGYDANGLPIALDQTKELESDKHGKVEQLISVDDGPIAGGRAFQFQRARQVSDPTGGMQTIPAGTIRVPSTAAMRRSEGVGFRVDVKPFETGVTIFDHENGAQRLTLNAQGHFVYSVRTASGTATAISDETYDVDAWYSVAGRVYNDVLTLSINQRVVAQQALTEDILYASAEPELVIGGDFAGRMKSFRFYDWSSPDLLRFQNGLPGDPSRTTVTIGESGWAPVTVLSLGQMNKSQFRSSIESERVAVKISGAASEDLRSQSRHYIVVVSQAYYLTIGGLVFESPVLNPGRPDIDVDDAWHASNDSPLLRRYVPKAHALFDFLSSNTIKETLWTALNVVVPIESTVTLATQLKYLVTGDARLSWFDLVSSAIDVASMVPLLAPLKFAKPAAKFFKIFANNPVTRAVGDAIATAINLFRSGKAQKLLNLAPFLVILAEMVGTPEGRESLGAMVDAIKSADDLWAWVDYLRLPSGGWAQNTAPPEITSLASLRPRACDHGGENQCGKNSLIPYAHASKIAAWRAVGARVTAALRELTQAGINAGELTPALRAITSRVGSMSQEAKLLIHSGGFLRASTVIARKGRELVASMIEDSDAERIRLQYLIAILLYLEYEMRPAQGGNAEGDLRQFTPQIETLMLKAFFPVKNPSNAADPLLNARHGARFHLFMIAMFDLKQAVGGPPIFAIEQKRPIFVFPSMDRRRARQPLNTPYYRTPDIILGTSAAEQWIELKSVQFTRPTGVKSPPRITRSHLPNARQATVPGLEPEERPGHSYHREFVGDRIALHYTDANALVATELMDEIKRPSKVRWWFHAYRARNQSKGATDLEVKDLRTAFCRAPSVRGSYNAVDMLKGTFNIATLTAQDLESKCGAKDGLGETLADDLIEQITSASDPEDIRVEAFDWTDLAGELSDYLPQLAAAVTEQGTP